MSRSCSHLSELRRALADGHWPHASSPELRAHVGSCPHCTQEALLSTHLQQARAHAVAAARPMSSSLIWWRAQARRRQLAMERATRPLLAAHLFVLLVALATAGFLIASHWQTILGHAAAAPVTISDAVTVFGLGPLIAAGVFLASLGGVVLYLATDRG